MKALTVKNPWAILIAIGLKDIENRTWKTKYRGRIYIHAGQSLACKLSGLPTLVGSERFKQANVYGKYRLIMALGFKKSVIIGEVDIVDCVQNHPSMWADKAEEYNPDIHEYAPVIWNWVLANPVLYDKPIENVKGALSLWDFAPPSQ